MSNKDKKKSINNYKNKEDIDLPDFIPLEMYKETFGGLENVTEEWYRNNEPDVWLKNLEWFKNNRG